jgi:S1-C subfamily serine protease
MRPVIRLTPLWLALVMFFGMRMLQSSTKTPATDPEPLSRIDQVLGLKTVPGAFITDVVSGGPAQRAGFDVCNLIAGFNGRTLREFGELPLFINALREAAASTGLDVDVWRSLNPDAGFRRDRVKIRFPLPTDARIGVELTFQVMVQGIVAGGPAEAAGVGVGEFIDQINDQSVPHLKSLADLDQKVREFVDRDGAVTLTLARWHPIRGSEVYRTGFVTREVVVKVAQAADSGK